MPRRRSSFGAPRRQGPRRGTLWVAGPDETAFVTVAAGAADLQGTANAALLALEPFTIMRVIGLLTVKSDQAAADEEFHGAFGIAVVSQQASATGTGAIPTPITEAGSDYWLAFQYATGAFSTGGGAVSRSFVVESRAMRKVEEGMDVVSVFENGFVVGIDYLAAYRMLIKLH